MPLMLRDQEEPAEARLIRCLRRAVPVPVPFRGRSAGLNLLPFGTVSQEVFMPLVVPLGSSFAYGKKIEADGAAGSLGCQDQVMFAGLQLPGFCADDARQDVTRDFETH